MHGVNVIVALAKNGSTPITDTMHFAYNEFNFFNRHWYKHQCFFVDEYRIVVEPNGGLMGEDELGLYYPTSEVDWLLTGDGEKQSHEIGHAWIGHIITIENNLHAPSFDPVTQDSDDWILEGFDHLYGVLCINKSDVLHFLTRDYNYYQNMISSGKDDALVDLPKYSGQDAYTYYCKGGLMALYMHQKLKTHTYYTLNDFMRYLISKYNITTEFGGIGVEGLISTSDLLEELNFFSGLDFTADFANYVWSPDGAGCRSATDGTGRAFNTNWGITIGTKNIAANEWIVIRISVAAAWTGNISNISITW